MRTKGEILSESPRPRGDKPGWDSTASIHERLTIEVLIDTRDELSEIRINLLALAKHIETWLPKPPKS